MKLEGENAENIERNKREEKGKKKRRREE